MTRSSSCPSIEDLQKLLLGALAQDEAQRCESHLRECGDCLQAVQSLVKGVARFETLHLGPGALEKAADTGAQADEPNNRPRAPAPLTAPMDEPPEPLPERVGRYRILGRLGSGGMGTVYRGEDPELRRAVAVKVPHFVGPERERHLAKQRFLREARAAAAVRHPHVCPVFDVGEHDGVPFAVMAFVAGQSLADRLAGGARLDDPREAVTLTLQVAEGLAAVHAHGIVHRDLKPANILLDADGRAVLTDFGLARPLDDPEHLTTTGAMIGTPAFMAPEQVALGAGEVGPWSDQYSLAVVLYRMLTGRLPFEGGTLQVIHGIGHDPFPPPSRFRPELDHALECVILKAAARRHEDRYESVAAFAAALSNWLDARAVERSKGIWKPTLRRLASAAACVAAAVFFAGVGAVLAWQNLGTGAANPGPPATTSQIVLPPDDPMEPTRSPLDALRAEDIPAPERFDWQPKELVAVLGEHRWRHWGPVETVAVSPDGSLVASSGADGVCLRETRTGTVRGAWKGRGVAFHPDGTLAVGTAREVLFLDRVTGTARATRKTPSRASAISYSADGSTAAAVLDNPVVIHVWDAAAGKERLRIPLPGNFQWHVHDLALSRDGNLLAVPSVEGVKLWDTITGRAVAGPPPVNAIRVAFSPDGRTLAAGTNVSTIQLWSVADRRALPDLAGHRGPVSDVAFSPDGKALASASGDGTVRLWDVATGKQSTVFAGHSGAVQSVAFAADGRTVVSCGADATVRLWDAVTDKQTNGLGGYPTPATLLGVAADGRILAVGGTGYGLGAVMTWDVPGRKLLNNWVADESLSGLALAADGTKLATVGYQGAQLWEIGSAKSLPALEQGAGRATAVAVAANGTRLAAVCQRREGEQLNEVVHVWDLAERRLLGSFPAWGQSSYPGSLAFSRDGSLLAYAPLSRMFRAWEVETGNQRLGGVTPEGTAIRALSLTPDGATLLLAAAGAGGGAQLWDVAAQGPVATYHGGHGTDGIARAVLASGSIITTGFDGRIIRWFSPFEKTIWQFPGVVHQLAVTEDGRYLFTANSNGTVYVLRLVPLAK